MASSGRRCRLSGAQGGTWSRIDLTLISGREDGGDQLGLTGAVAEAVQRARQRFAVTDYVRNAPYDSIGLAVLPTRDSVPFAGMGQAVQHNPDITVQNDATTGGPVFQTDKMTFIH